MSAQQEQDTPWWQKRLRKALAERTENHPTRLATKQRIRQVKLTAAGETRFSGTQECLTVKFGRRAVLRSNMQSNEAAFEGWAIAFKEWCGVERVVVDWDGADRPCGEEDRQSGHFQRFVYRATRFSELFPDWFGVAHPDRLGEARALSEEHLTLNVARGKGANPAASRDGVAGAEPGTEHELELHLLESPRFSAHFGPFTLLDHQFPVGLNSPQGSVFPGRKSAIDLVGIAGDTLKLFELKATHRGKGGRRKPNMPVGILSETLFYTWMLRDAMGQAPRFGFASDKVGGRAVVTPRDVRGCRRIEAVMLAREVHPLFGQSQVLARLNAAADRLAAAQPERVPFSFRATEHQWNTEAGDCDFTDVVVREPTA